MFDVAKHRVNTKVHELVSSWKYVRWDKFVPAPMNSTQMNKKGDMLCNDFITLDTETSWNHDEENSIGWIYQWAFTYQGQVVFGRKPSELIKALKAIEKVNNIGEYSVCESGAVCNKIDVYVHNLSYDYSYIGDWLRDAFGCMYRSGECSQTMLAIAPHSLIIYESAGFRFLCSFKLTHKSLAQWGKDMNTPHRKLVGTVDYDKINYQDSPLSFTDWKYMFYDVIVLDECLRTQLRIYNDDLLTVPLTVTGYVRRAVKNEYLKNKFNRYGFLDRRLNYDFYSMCKEEFSGGLTHGNRHYAGRTIRVGDIINGRRVKAIGHNDFRSHYPSQQRAYEFPISKPILYYDSEIAKKKGIKPLTMKQVLQITKTKCVLVRMRVSYAELKDSAISIPYLQFSHCTNGGFSASDMLVDNGRVIKCGTYSADRKYDKSFTIVCNEDDLKILMLQYKMCAIIEKVVTFRKGKLPKYLIDSIDNFFKGKTDYKDQVKALEELKVSGADPRFIEACTNLMIAKGMLNGIYGMSATDPVRESYVEDYEQLDAKERWSYVGLSDEDKEETLDNYYSDFTHFMDFQFGCWTTSHARLELIKFCIIVGWDAVLYGDTDSIYYIIFEDSNVEEKINAENKRLMERAESIGAFIVSDKGKKVHYDQFEREKEDIVSFRFLHAKCYAYEVIKYRKDGKPLLDCEGNKQFELKCVIAGVKRFGTDENGKTISRESELGSIDNLAPSFVFKACGGMTKKYVYSMPHIEYVNGHALEVASSCILMKTTKTLKGMEQIIEDHIGMNRIFTEIDCEE